MKQNKSHKLLVRILLFGGVFFCMHTAFSQDFKVRGRLHMDALYGIHDADAFSNGFNNRRARLGAGGKIDDNWDGQIEIDFADAVIVPNDFRLRRSYENGARIWIGQFKVPHGLNELTSSNAITFIERSSANNAFVSMRRMGIAFEYNAETFGLMTMVYGRALGQRAALIDDMPMGIGLRAYTSQKIGEDGGVFHVGGSASFEHLMDTLALGFSDRPEARDSKGGSVRYLRTTVPDAQSTLRTGIEVLVIKGPLSIEGEFNMASINRYIGNTTSFYGFHIQTSYVLTGESRRYSNGIVGGISPQGEKGAWEVAARFSLVDLNDEDLTGGDQSNITLGVNYYVSSRLRFMGNIILISTDKTDDSPILGLLRAQYNF